MPPSTKQPCSCPSELQLLLKSTAVDRLGAAAIVDYAQRAVAVTRASRTCPMNCSQSPGYDEATVKTLGQVLDFLGALWLTSDRPSNTHRPNSEGTPRSQSASSDHSRSNQTPRKIATRDDTATFGRLTLDKTETDLLVEESVRALTTTINEIAVEAQDEAQDVGAGLHQKSARYAAARSHEQAWRDLIERTYTALASYGSDGVSNS